MFKIEIPKFIRAYNVKELKFNNDTQSNNLEQRIKYFKLVEY